MNNFDILRLCFALTVVLAHSAALSQSPTLAWMPHVFDSRIAVEGFFAMSGFLIVGSYERTPVFLQYLTKRACRILPAYWVALCFSLVLGTLLTTLSLAGFLTSHETWTFSGCNLIFANYLHPTLPGVFTHNPGESAVNGALWTIKLEVLFYLLVPGLVWACRRLGQWQTLSAIFICSLVYREVFHHLHLETLAKQLPGQLCYFVAGSLIYYYLPQFTRNKALTWSLVGITAAAYVCFRGQLLEALLVPVATMAVAFLTPHITGPTKYGDFSYGIYVFHFPIIQALVAVGAFSAHPYRALFIALLAVSAMAAASWHWVEFPSLGLKRFSKSDASRRLTVQGIAEPAKETSAITIP